MTITCIRPGTDEYRARRARLGFRSHAAASWAPDEASIARIGGFQRATMPSELRCGNKRIIRAIIAAISRHYGIKRGVLLSGAITPTVRWPRALCFYMAKSQTGLPFTEIARVFGVNYGTVSKAHAQIGAILRDNPEFADEVRALASRIRQEHGNGKDKDKKRERESGDRAQF